MPGFMAMMSRKTGIPERKQNNSLQMIRCIALLLICSASVKMTAQKTDCLSCKIYQGFISGDITMWEGGMAELESEFGRLNDPCTLFALAEARYGYIGYKIGTGKRSEARSLLDVFESDIERLSVYKEYMAETEAFRIALMGYIMELNPARKVTLGPGTLRLMEKAMEEGPSNASVWTEKANCESYMPAFAGGSKSKAAGSFREALRLYEAGGSMSGCNWRYLNTMVSLGQLLEKMGDFVGAKEIYLKALTEEPGFRRVRDELLPEAEKNIR